MTLRALSWGRTKTARTLVNLVLSEFNTICCVTQCAAQLVLHASRLGIWLVPFGEAGVQLLSCLLYCDSIACW